MKVKAGAPLLDVKADGESGQITGYGSIFGNIDSYGDIVLPGAYAKSLKAHARAKTMPKLFWQHNPDRPIGKWTEIVEDDKGLRVTGQLNMNVQLGREAHAHLMAGDIDGLSIGYRVVKGSIDEAQNAFLLKEVDLIEVSIVSLAANSLATVEGVKGDVRALVEKLAAGDRLTKREWETVLKEFCDLSNSAAERVVRVNGLGDGQGEPDGSASGADFLAAMVAAMRDAPIIDSTGEPD